MTDASEVIKYIEQELNKQDIHMTYSETIGDPGEYAYNIQVEPKMEGYELEDIIDEIIGDDEPYFVTVIGGRCFDKGLTGEHGLSIYFKEGKLNDI